MTNMDVIVDLRSEGLKPRFVHIDIVETIDRGLWPMSPKGSVFCEIKVGEPLADIDFRPLRGLKVHLRDYTGNGAYARRAAALIVAVDPAFFAMPVPVPEDPGGFIVHRRWGGDSPRTDSYRI